MDISFVVKRGVCPLGCKSVRRKVNFRVRRVNLKNKNKKYDITVAAAKSPARHCEKPAVRGKSQPFFTEANELKLACNLSALRGLHHDGGALLRDIVVA